MTDTKKCTVRLKYTVGNISDETLMKITNKLAMYVHESKVFKYESGKDLHFCFRWFTYDDKRFTVKKKEVENELFKVFGHFAFIVEGVRSKFKCKSKKELEDRIEVVQKDIDKDTLLESEYYLSKMEKDILDEYVKTNNIKKDNRHLMIAKLGWKLTSAFYSKRFCSSYLFIPECFFPKWYDSSKISLQYSHWIEYRNSLKEDKK